MVMNPPTTTITDPFAAGRVLSLPSEKDRHFKPFAGHQFVGNLGENSARSRPLKCVNSLSPKVDL